MQAGSGDLPDSIVRSAKYLSQSHMNLIWGAGRESRKFRSTSTISFIKHEEAHSVWLSNVPGSCLVPACGEQSGAVFHYQDSVEHAI